MQTNGFAGFMIPEFLHYAMTIVQHANNWLLAGLCKQLDGFMISGLYCSSHSLFHLLTLSRPHNFFL
jgi:hypothetical protein